MVKNGRQSQNTLMEQSLTQSDELICTLFCVFKNFIIKAFTH